MLTKKYLNNCIVKRGYPQTISGYAPLILYNNVGQKINNIIMYGKNIQDGLQTPTVQKTISNVNGNLEILGIDDTNLLSFEIPLLNGIKVNQSSAKYTYIDDSNNKYVSDIFEYTQGVWKHTQNLGMMILDGTENWYLYASGYSYALDNTAINMLQGNYAPLMCTHFKPCFSISEINSSTGTGLITQYDNGVWYLNYDGQVGGVDAFKTWLAAQNTAGTPIIIIYQLNSPIITYYSNIVKPIIPRISVSIKNTDGTKSWIVANYNTMGRKEQSTPKIEEVFNE